MLQEMADTETNLREDKNGTTCKQNFKYGDQHCKQDVESNLQREFEKENSTCTTSISVFV